MQLELQDRVILVSGGASGIGRGISTAFASEGAKVALTWYTSESGATETVAAIDQRRREALAYPGRSREPGEATRVVGDVVAAFGQLDVVVANSGDCSSGARLKRARSTSGTRRSRSTSPAPSSRVRRRSRT